MKIEIYLAHETKDLGVEGIRAFPYATFKIESTPEEINAIKDREVLSAISRLINFSIQHMQ